MTTILFSFRMEFMKTNTFKGGIHPPEFKELTQEMKLESVSPSTKTVAIPVTQGGAPNTPCVKVGDSVARGQKIASGESPMSVPVHASIAGTVKKIETRMVAGNLEAPCIIIQSDDSDRTEFMPPLDPFKCSKEEALARIKEAGIVGMGGAGFPTHIKFNPPAGKTIEYVLANAAECEPYLTVDERAMAETPDKFVDGLAIAMKITGAQQGLIVLEDNKAYLCDTLQEAIKKNIHGSPISICLCKTKYPQGGEKSVTMAALGREIPAGGLPADIGCCISNVTTLCSISEAFREGKPVIDRTVTFSGMGCKTRRNLRLPIGTVVAELMPQEIEADDTVVKIVAGGPMMGMAMTSANFPVTKTTSGVLFLTAKETFLVDEDPCIGCGSCIDHCPYRLSPVLMVRSMTADEYHEANRYGLMDCVECGTCSYVCPSHIRLVQRFKVGKSIFRDLMAKEKAKAEKEKRNG